MGNAHKGQPLGKHTLVDYFDCKSPILDRESELRAALLEAVRDSGTTIITDVFHRFSPQGISGVIVVAESHVAIHTWPEHHCVSIDIFSCSDRMNVETIISTFEKSLQAGTSKRSIHNRGISVPAQRV